MTTNVNDTTVPQPVTQELETTWDCPICRDLLFKPCVNICGHVFCFWCFHFSMNPLGDGSPCPLCRSSFPYLPAVSPLLHSLLASEFPQQYKQREQETIEEEKELKSSSPSIPTTNITSTSCTTTTTTSAAAFTCCNPDCGKMLTSSPLLLPNCGHHVCGEACLALVDNHDTNTNTTTNNIESPRGRRCPQCMMRVVRQPAPCRLLGDYLKRKYSEQVGQRDVEYQEMMNSNSSSSKLPPWPTADGKKEQQGGGEGMNNDEAEPQEQEQEEEEDGEGQQQQNQRQQQQQQQQSQEASPSPSPSPSGQAHRTRIISSIKTYQTGADYVHLGVGCDECGEYPILNDRYKCLDCPEECGYDLCGTCYKNNTMKRKRDSDDGGSGGTTTATTSATATNADVAVGRFNQQHKPDHRMELQQRKMTGLHVLKALHPEMTTAQLMRWVEMAEEGDREGGEGGEAEQEQGDQGGGDDDDDPEEFLHMRRGGPRPEP